MGPYHHHPSDRSFRERQSRMVRAVGDYGRHVSYHIAAEEHHRSAVVYADRERRVAEAGLHPSGIRPSIVAMRQATGAVVIRIGERLRGTPVPATTTVEVHLA